MTELFELLQVLQLVVYGSLALAAIAHWRRRRDEASGWLALTLGSFGALILMARFVPGDSTTLLVTVADKLLLVILILFPYLLYRFMASLVAPIPWFFWFAAALTALTVVAALVIDVGDLGTSRGATEQAFVFLVVFQWVLLSGRVGFRLWKEGGRQPVFARRKMRTLSLGAIGMALVIALAGMTSSNDERINGLQIAIQLLALASGPLFLLGFAPPAVVRMLWRQSEGVKFRTAEAGLVEASTPQEVADVLLPHVCRFVGGAGAALLRRDRTLVGYDGMAAEEAEALAEDADDHGPDGEKRERAKTLVVPMKAGALVVRSSALSPFFGEEEVDMVRRLALLADLALARAELFQRSKQSHEQLQEAQRIASLGSWEWDVATDTVEWSDEVYRIYGRDPLTLAPNFESYLDAAHPDDLERAEQIIRTAVEQKSSFEFEHRIIRPSGEERTIAARGKTLLDEKGELIKMIGTAQDVTERKKEEILRETFIANAAHELRTPLTSLLGLVDVLGRRNDRLRPDQREQAVEVMERSGARLASLVDNLLDLTKLQQGQLEIIPEPMEIDEVCRDILQSEPAPEEKSVTVDVPGGLIVRADKHRMYQVVSNLLTNAYRYGGDNIILKGEARDGSVFLSVSDDGPGLEHDVADRLFEPFARGSASAGAGGSGLGLAIVKMLVEASEGEIWHEPVEPTGVRFVIRLEPHDGS
ncbi:MAG: ATP-binding protein [Actinomycetota bacterium]